MARIAGIAIRVDWSVALLALLFVFDFTARLTSAGTPATVAVLGGMLAAILFFGSILAHEMAHALVARLGGIQTKDIALHVFGGLARLTGEPRSGRQEIAIAGAGPATNWVLAAALAGPTLALRAAPGPVCETLASVFGWAAGANAVLGGLNLLPAFPLDGGRVLRVTSGTGGGICRGPPRRLPGPVAAWPGPASDSPSGRWPLGMSPEASSWGSWPS